MALQYFKINGTDYSEYVNELKVTKQQQYNAQVNAAGNTVVDLINSKRQIQVGFIPMDEAKAQDIFNAIDMFTVTISYRDPRTGATLNDVNCIIPSSDADYYTIRADKVSLKAFTLKFTEL